MNSELVPASFGREKRIIVTDILSYSSGKGDSGLKRRV